MKVATVSWAAILIGAYFWLLQAGFTPRSAEFWFGQPDSAGLSSADNIRNAVWAIGLIFGGIFGALTFVNSMRRTELIQMEQAQETNRHKSEIFANSSQRLSAAEITTRIGAVNALESLLLTSVDHYHLHRQCTETLCAFIHVQSRENLRLSTQNRRLEFDIANALSALTRNGYSEKSTSPDYFVRIWGALIKNREFPYYFDIPNINFYECDFSRSIFNNSNFCESEIELCSFDESKIYRSQLSKCEFSNSTFMNSEIESTKIYNSDFQYCDFRNAKLSSCTLSHCNFLECDFTNTNLSNTSFVGSVISGSIFKDVDGKSCISVAQLADAVWHPDSPPIVGSDCELPHRGDGRAADSNSPLDRKVYLDCGIDASNYQDGAQTIAKYFDYRRGR